MIGKVYNAKRCTVSGEDCWMAAVYTDEGRFACGGATPFCHGDLNVADFDSPEECVAWLHQWERERGKKLARIDIETSGSGCPEAKAQGEAHGRPARAGCSQNTGQHPASAI